MERFRKLVGALLGGVTGGAVIAVCAAFGLVLDPATAATVAAGLAAVGTFLAKPNAV